MCCRFFVFHQNSVYSLAKRKWAFFRFLKTSFSGGKHECLLIRVRPQKHKLKTQKADMMKKLFWLE